MTSEQAVKGKDLEIWEWRVVEELHNPGQVTYPLSAAWEEEVGATGHGCSCESSFSLK